MLVKDGSHLENINQGNLVGIFFFLWNHCGIKSQISLVDFLAWSLSGIFGSIRLASAVALATVNRLAKAQQHYIPKASFLSFFFSRLLVYLTPMSLGNDGKEWISYGQLLTNGDPQEILNSMEKCISVAFSTYYCICPS